MISSPLVDRLIALALEEDLSFGDVTSDACVPPAHQSLGKVLARERLICCGLPLLGRIVSVAAACLQVKLLKAEGDDASEGTVLAEVRGSTRNLLALERTMLNFLQRMSGVASFARDAVERVPGIMVLDTRKTMPGWRVLDKYACKVGGAHNHRLSLGDMVLVKNNHIDVQPGANAGARVRAALTAITASKGPYVPLEVEVRSIEELRAALEFHPQMIMLDNMEDSLVREAVQEVKRLSPATVIEASGGITPERLHALATSGVNCVSMGSLTTRAPNKDISLRITPL